MPYSVPFSRRCVVRKLRVVTDCETRGNMVAEMDIVTSEHGRTHRAKVPRQAVPLVMLHRSILASLRVCRGVSAVTWASMTLETRATVIIFSDFSVIGFTVPRLKLAKLKSGWHPKFR